MLKNNLKIIFLISVLNFLGHFCFGQNLSEKAFQPIKLKKDSTHIYLEDYFPDIKKTAYRITHEPKGVDVRVYKNYEVILYGELQNPVDYLGISVDFIEKAIPLKKNISQEDLKSQSFITTTNRENESIEIYRAYPATRLLALINNRPIPDEYFQFLGKKVILKIPDFVKKISVADLRIFGFNFHEITNDIWIPLSYGKPISEASLLTPQNEHTNIIYALAVDRWNNGNKANDEPINEVEVPRNADWQGGDFKGIDKMLNQKYFEQMGYNCILIYPIFQNPPQVKIHTEDAFLSAPYWGLNPISDSIVESRWGIEKEFSNIIGKAHLKKINVLLGLSLNSNYEQNKSKIFKAFKKFPIDGFAYWHQDNFSTEFIRKITFEINEKIAMPQKRSFFQYSVDSSIFEHLQTGLIQSQEAKKLYKTGREVFLKNENPAILAETLEKTLINFGSHHLLGVPTGRESDKRIKAIASESSDNEDWGRIKQLFVFNHTIPGIPITFYGDEIGLEEKNGMMKFIGLNTDESSLRNFVAQLNKLRRENMALMYGETQILQSDKNTLIYTRSYLGQKIIIAFNTGQETHEFSLDLPDFMKDEKFYSNYFTPVEQVYRKLNFNLPPHGFEIFINQSNF